MSVNDLLWSPPYLHTNTIGSLLNRNALTFLVYGFFPLSKFLKGFEFLVFYSLSHFHDILEGGRVACMYIYHLSPESLMFSHKVYFHIFVLILL